MSADGEVRIEAPERAAGEASATRARHAAVLAELSELGLTLARDLHARAIQAETADEAVTLSLSFQRVSRAVRQAVALEARIERDAARDLKADRLQEQKARDEAGERRRARVREGVRRGIRGEADGPFVERLCAELDELVEAEAEAAGFAEARPAEVIARICARLGLPSPDERLEELIADREEAAEIAEFAESMDDEDWAHGPWVEAADSAGDLDEAGFPRHPHPPPDP